MPQSHIAAYDAVIALANRMDGSGELNDTSRERVDEAIRCVRAGTAPVLVCCGWAYLGNAVSIADAMKRHAVENQGLAPDAVLTEPLPRDTVGEAVFSKRNLALPGGWTRILIVTSAYHVPRALEIFSFVYGPGFEVRARGVDDGRAADRAAAEARSLAAFRDTFRGVEAGDDAAIIDCLCERHPFYNGAVHPKIEPHK